MLHPGGLFWFALLAFPISLSVALPTGGNGHSSSSSSGDSSAGANYGGINVPIPSISFGLPSMREARAYVTDRLRTKQRRRPEVGNLPRDAVQPHKAPVPDSAVAAINSADQSQKPNHAEKPYSEISATDLDDALGYGPSNSTNKLDDEIQSMASSGFATSTPVAYSKDGAPVTSEDNDPNSLSHSLGTISHSRFEVEDRGKMKRDQVEDQGYGKYRKEMINGTKYYFIPTIWNSNVSIDDLDYWETQDLDTILALEDFIRRHRGKPGTNGSSSVGLSGPLPLGEILNAMTSLNLTEPSSAASRPPKSLARTFGLISHSKFRDKSHRGHRRDANRYVTLKDGRAGAEKEPASKLPLLVSSRQSSSAKMRREGDDPLDALDISDEAYDEFRKKYPKFFGSGWKKERSLSTITESGQSLHPRNPVSPSWLAMLFSPSALLEKRPFEAANSVTKRDSSQDRSGNKPQKVPNGVPLSSGTALSSLEREAPSPLVTSDTHMTERRDTSSQHENGITGEDIGMESARRSENLLNAYHNDRTRDDKRQTPPTPPVRRDGSYMYAVDIARKDPGHGTGIPHTDEWFESAFTEAWDEEHSRKKT